MIRSALLALSLLMLSACSWYPHAREPAVALSFVSPPYTFVLPPEMVDGARVLSTRNKGLAIVRGKTYIAIDTISSDAMGFPELDMRRYPGVIWGEEQPSVYPAELHAEIARVRQFYADHHPNLESPIALNQGTAWLAYGEEETVTLLMHKDYPDILVRLYTRKVPIEVVREKIIGPFGAVSPR
jgi:hypothetical protein